MQTNITPTFTPAQLEHRDIVQEAYNIFIELHKKYGDTSIDWMSAGELMYFSCFHKRKNKPKFSNFKHENILQYPHISCRSKMRWYFYICALPNYPV